jgi:hypothetical protein
LQAAVLPIWPRLCDVEPAMSPLEVLRRSQPPVSDEDFDAMYPEWVQKLSEMFWTPVAVAVRASELLVENEGDRILDIGSGVGKFCLIGAATTAGVFHGVEQREGLVDLARGVASQHRWTEGLVDFRHGDMSDESLEGYAGIYLYNPFFEQTSGPWAQIDKTVRYSRETQQRYIDTLVEKLEATPTGTRVATYFGFGAKLPASFRKIAYEQFDKGPLEVWLQEA